MKVKCLACNTEFEPVIKRTRDGREIECHVCHRRYRHAPTNLEWDNWIGDRRLDVIEPEKLPPIEMLKFTRNLHRHWFDTQVKRNVVWGPERTQTTHPCMKLIWDEIPPEEQANDVGMVLDIFACLDEMGFKVVPKDKNE